MGAAIAIAAAAPADHRAIAAELDGLARQLRAVTVRIQGSARFDAVGAGVLWRADEGVVVVTNAHVVPPNRGDDVHVEGVRGYEAKARVVARSRDLDLAILGLDNTPNELAVATVGDARSLRSGEIIVALGHPFGVPGAFSLGVVHAMPNGEDGWLRADIRLAPGNSGGPLATLDGAVVGINCMIARGLGIAISSHLVDRFINEVLSPP